MLRLLSASKNNFDFFCRDVADGELGNQGNFNSSFMDREVDTDTIGRVDLNNVAAAASGPTIANIQRSINGAHSFLGSATEGAFNQLPSWASDDIGDPNDDVFTRVNALQPQVESDRDEIISLRTLSGTGTGVDDLGTFTGTTITDNTVIKTALQELETEVELKEDAANKGVANGYASLDSGGRLPTSQLPTSATEYKGAYDASGGGSGSPSLTDGSGTNGDLYRVSAAGTVDHGAGNVTYAIGDAVIYNGSVWQKIPSDSPVTSVNSLTGIVVLDTDDIGEGATNLYFTNARADARIAAANIDDLSDVDVLGVLDGQVLTYNAGSGNWEAGEGGAGGGGSLSLVTGRKSNFDSEVPPDWDLYKDAAADTPADGDDGTSLAFTITHETTNPLFGAGSLKLDKAAVDGLGEGLRLDAISVDEIFRGKTSEFRFQFKTSANYEAGDLRCFLYDITNAQLLNVLTLDSDGSIPISSSTGSQFIGTVSIPANCTSVRAIIHQTNNDATRVWNIIIDEFKIAEISTVVSLASEPWTSFTPTGSWTTNTTYAGLWRRVGENLEVEVKISLTGAPNATALGVDLPPNLTMDTARIVNGDSVGRLGTATLWDNGSSVRSGIVSRSTDTRVGIRAEITGNGYDNDPVDEVTPFTFASGDTITLNFSVPIVGWEVGNVLSTAQADFKNLKIRASRQTSVQTISSTSPTTVIYNTIDEATHPSAFNASTGVFTAPAPDYYFYNAQIRVERLTAADKLNLRVSKNSSTTLSSLENTSGVTQWAQGLSDIVYLEEGETLEVTSDSTADSDYDISFTTNGTVSYFNIVAVPDFSVFGVSGKFETQYQASSTKTPANATINYYQMTGNDLTLPPGTWHLLPSQVDFNNSGAADWTRVFAQWYAANGADTSTKPALLDTLSGVTIISGEVDKAMDLETAAIDDYTAVSAGLIIKNTSEITIYLVPGGILTTAANGRVTVYPQALRLQ